MSFMLRSWSVRMAAICVLAMACSTAVKSQERGGKFCGGIAAFQCPDDLVCIDDPRDDCHPETGADCGGICVKPRCDRKERRYISMDPDECATLRFFCEPGTVPFFDECGCGCEQAP